MRTLFRLSVLGLAGYGVKALYDRYGDRLRSLGGPAEELTERAAHTATDLKDDLAAAGDLVGGSVRATAEDLRLAAEDAADEARRRLAEVPRSPTGPPADRTG
jgi:hypothetical protein